MDIYISWVLTLFCLLMKPSPLVKISWYTLPRAVSHDVMAAILVSLSNTKTTAMLFFFKPIQLELNLFLV